MTSLIVARAFDKAAPSYDSAAHTQAQVAKALVAAASSLEPRSILDIGCGTGFVLTEAAARWPAAALTGLDAAPAMLAEAKRKVPRLATLCADAGDCDAPLSFDLIFSSMMLHWFPEPGKTLMRWRRWLPPQGVLFVAVPVAGSLDAWRTLCETAGVGHGLWPFPPADLADGLACACAMREHPITYGCVLDFLRALKKSGGGTARADHKPISSASLRKLVREARRPFRVSYKVLYAQINAIGAAGHGDARPALTDE